MHDSIISPFYLSCNFQYKLLSYQFNIQTQMISSVTNDFHPHSENAVILQLIQTRNQYLSELLLQLNVNKVLLNGTFTKLLNQTYCRPEKSLCILKNEQINSINSQMVQCKKMLRPQMRNYEPGPHKIKNKISHNSAMRNDTKNIPKNYGKSILTFIRKSPKTRRLLSQRGIPFPEFMMHVRKIKKKVNSIESLRNMWGSEDLSNPIRKCIRILSYEFMRKHCLVYIFHSKVRNYRTHVKYRSKLIEGIQNPTSFSHMKDF